MRTNFKEDIEKKYIDLLVYKKGKEVEIEELKGMINKKNARLVEAQRRVEGAQQEKEFIEEQFQLVKKDFSKLNEANKESLGKQRESFEVRIKEMEEEITKLSIGRYKVELEQKQKFLKVSKRYDE